MFLKKNYKPSLILNLNIYQFKYILSYLKTYGGNN